MWVQPGVMVRLSGAEQLCVYPRWARELADVEGKPVHPMHLERKVRESVLGTDMTAYHTWVGIYEWLGRPLPKPPRSHDLSRMVTALQTAFKQGALVAFRGPYDPWVCLAQDPNEWGGASPKTEREPRRERLVGEAAGTTWFALRVVDEVGDGIEGVALTYEVLGEKREATTNAAGEARIETLSTGFASAAVKGLEGMRATLRARWEGARGEEKIVEGPRVVVREMGEGVLAPIGLECEKVTTLVIRPCFLRVLVFDSTGDAIPSRLSPIAATVDICASEGGSTFIGLPILEGMADVPVILPGDSPACELTFSGFAESEDLVPNEAPPAMEVEVPPSLVRGMLDGPHSVTRRDLSRVQHGTVGRTAVFQLRRRAASVIECEHFRAGGAILLPGCAPGGERASAGIIAVRGIDALRAAAAYADGYDSTQVLIVGHGAHSQDRADGVRALLVGDAGGREVWIGIAQERATLAELQAILKWAAGEFGWGCDPGEIDGIAGPMTEWATREFQATYNADKSEGLFPDGCPVGRIYVDGIVGPQTLGAMFDCYERALYAENGGDGRRPLPGTGLRAIGSGMHHLSTPFADDPLRRASERAVEVLFFDDGEEPSVVCTEQSASPCIAATCELYDPREYTFEYVSVGAIKTLTPFRISVLVNADTPWTLEDRLVLIDAGGALAYERRLGDGVLIGTRRVFQFADYDEGERYRGEIWFGEERFVLFEPSEVSKIQDPASDTCVVACAAALYGAVTS